MGPLRYSINVKLDGCCKTGELSSETSLPFPGIARPATCMVNGRQYIAVATSSGRAPKLAQKAPCWSPMRYSSDPVVMKPRLLLGLAFLWAVSASAQLLPPNADGISMGHVHLTVRDIDANKSFFVLLGGDPVSNGPLELIGFPGLYVMLRKGRSE